MNKSLLIRVVVAIATVLAVAGNLVAKFTMKNYWLNEGIFFAPHSSYPVNLFSDILDYMVIVAVIGFLIFACMTAVSNPKTGLVSLTIGIPAGVVISVYFSLVPAGILVPVQTVTQPKTGVKLMLIDKSSSSNYAWDIVRPVPDTQYQWRRIFGGSGDQIDLSYSVDGGLTSSPRLYVSEDGNRLFVQRGGLWTDCVDISKEPATMCSATPLRRMIAEAWEKRSRQIEKLVKAAAVKY